MSKTLLTNPGLSFLQTLQCTNIFLNQYQCQRMGAGAGEEAEAEAQAEAEGCFQVLEASVVIT
ncbi:hypothetical protein DPMN_049618 [Dreissena polymorpha]|uniref:Uncharacterized protein n=1 Tax=Dreissena polymorpha TaxID=45954 RepID=A0A9D4HNH0_DREPO|nr:hypothetical protein DPMN_049618 [Dreissena polymorpha]